MPIFEFKCLKCNEVFELLTFGSDEAEVSCPNCRSESFERIISSTNYNMGGTSGKGARVSSQTRNCSSGSCTTYTVPGPNG